jgi:hypothetical protein
MFVTRALACAALCAVPSRPGQNCKIDDIAVLQADWQRTTPGGPDVEIVGELFNGCREPIGARVQITFLDANGKVVGVSEEWPASIRNIESKSSYPFSLVYQVDERAKQMKMRVISVRRWESR